MGIPERVRQSSVITTRIPERQYHSMQRKLMKVPAYQRMGNSHTRAGLLIPPEKKDITATARVNRIRIEWMKKLLFPFFFICTKQRMPAQRTAPDRVSKYTLIDVMFLSRAKAMDLQGF